MASESKESYSLFLSSAGISYAIPNWLWDITSMLHYLDISGNEIRGKLPNLSFYFDDFHLLNLSSNHFEGPIPQFSFSVIMLDLSKNMFSGPVSSICTASKILNYVDLSDNLLSGELPKCLMNLKYLTILNLANIKLSGKILSSIGSLVRIEVLHLRNNSFTGELPSSLKKCYQLSTIDLGENGLSGTIPAWIGESLSNLVVLSLRSNAFSGIIPLELCHPARILIFDLSVNNISGTIPNCLNNFSAMAQNTGAKLTITSNYISKNRISYILQDYIEHATLLWKGREYEYSTTLGLIRVINLSSNKLMGKIPSEIMDLLGLIGLNLSRNCLTGVINQKIGQLRMLDFIDLSRNQLSGEIPTSLSQLSFIGVLDLSYNNLSGIIPISTQLQSFSPSSYVGNSGLCGPPLTVECQAHGRDNVSTEEDEEMLTNAGFFLSMGLGFAIAFGGVCGTLLLNTSCRYAYFMLLNNIKDWLYATIIVNKARLQRWWLG